ncbi:hypothetical protein RI367_004332 [Sorochytrium milnesiophthora]
MSNVTLQMDPATVYLQQVGAIDTLPYLSRTSASMSFIGAVAVLLHIYKTWREINGTPQRILLWITLVDLILIPAGLMARSVLDSPIGCSVQGVLVQFGQMTSAHWGTLHAVIILMSVAFRIPTAKIVALEPWYHLVGFGVPFIMTLTPILVADKPGVPLFGDAQVWCWFRIEYSSYRLIWCYGLVLSLLAFSLIVYVVVGVRVWRDTGNKALKEASRRSAVVRQRYAMRTTLYFMAFLLTWLFAAINRVRSFALPTAHPLPLVVELHAWYASPAALF